MSACGETGQTAEVEHLRAEVERLRAELDQREREAADKERQLERYAADLRETFKRERARAEQLEHTFNASVTALANAVERRDVYTAKHAERVTAYGIEIVHAMNSGLADDPATRFGFLLHDVGKVAIADAILLKTGPLSHQEREVMKQHPVIGAEIVRDFLGDAAEVVRHHHERWDGRGYPDGLAGEEIPLAARVFAVADVLDALTTDRPYRPASPIPIARAMIVAETGRHFDPEAIEAFEQIGDERFAEIGAAIR